MAPKRLSAMQRWGREFARARDAAGFSQASLAQHPDVHVSESLIAHWETGRKMPRITDRKTGEIKDLEDCEKVLGTNGYLKRLLLEWVNLFVSPEWSEWMAVEEEATGVRDYENIGIPGLLQSPTYVETILPPEKAEQRLERQRIFEEGTPPFFETLLDESILYRKVGGPAIMAEALNHLVSMGERDDVIVRILPLVADLTRLSFPFVLATVGSGKQLAFVEDARGGRILERPEDIAELHEVWGRYSALALSEQESRDLIRKTIEDRWPVT
jgi:transcriptional regulator with XRE-family HTH domain